MVDRYQYVDLNSYEIKINIVNVAVLEKIIKLTLDITYQHSNNNLNEITRLFLCSPILTPHTLPTVWLCMPGTHPQGPNLFVN